MAYAERRDIMMYPCSSSTRSLAVPGIGYCQSIPVDHDSFDPADFPSRPARRGSARIWADWTGQDPAEPAAGARELQ
jgi:hypothetical protein